MNADTGTVEVIEATGVVRPDSGGKEMGQSQPKFEAKWKAIGVVYVRADDGIVEIKVFYESHVDQAVKDSLMDRFGVGVHEWRP